MFSSEFSQMDSIFIMRNVILICCRAVLLISLLLRNHYSLIVFITSEFEAFRWQFEPPLREPATYHCWWAHGESYWSPIYYRGSSFHWLHESRAPLFVFPPLRRVGLVQNWVTWNLSSWLMCHTDTLSWSTCWSTWLLSVRPTRVMRVVY